MLGTERRELMLGRPQPRPYQALHPAPRSRRFGRGIVRLREIHAEIDHAVLEAYGWPDLDPEMGHHKTKLGARWTISSETRFELLDRLLVENHRRAEAQKAADVRGN